MERISRQLKQYGILLSLFFIFTSCAVASSPKSEVQRTYKAWCSAIGTARGNAHHVVKFYAPNALLLPTLSPKIMANAHGGLNDYFTSLTSYPNIKCTPNELITNVYGNLAINSGLYTFSYTDSKHGKEAVLPARFTFVYKKIGNEWLIVNHHSSVLPAES